MDTPEERKRREAAARIDARIYSRRAFLRRAGLTTVALLATLVPARRAARVQPIEVLSAE